MSKKILITGGAGFIGVNAAKHFFDIGWKVIVLDNLSRKNTDLNLKWLQMEAKIRFEKIDIRDLSKVERLIHELQPDAILHLAAQVAVTTSVINPREDFEINALGSFNLLEAVRNFSPHTFFINASTNKVYGKMTQVKTVERNGRYEYASLENGVSEDQQLDFHSPYGCSKGIADQYVIDYSRIFDIDTTTVRQSCIYGPRQFGVEDQGWIAWFTIAAILNKKITIYGDGKQIRDVLHVNDLILAYEAILNNRESTKGQAFNIGGGSLNTLSLLELLSILRKELSIEIPVLWDDWRPGDQPVFVCDLSKIKDSIGWKPTIDTQTGIKKLVTWVEANKKLFD